MKGHQLKVKMRVGQGPILGASHQQGKANQSTDFHNAKDGISLVVLLSLALFCLSCHCP